MVCDILTVAQCIDYDRTGVITGDADQCRQTPLLSKTKNIGQPPYSISRKRPEVAWPLRREGKGMEGKVQLPRVDMATFGDNNTTAPNNYNEIIVLQVTGFLKLFRLMSH